MEVSGEGGGRGQGKDQGSREANEQRREGDSEGWGSGRLGRASEPLVDVRRLGCQVDSDSSVRDSEFRRSHRCGFEHGAATHTPQPERCVRVECAPGMIFPDRGNIKAGRSPAECILPAGRHSAGRPAEA